MKQFLHSLAITLCIALMATGAQAQTITAEQAKEIANNFFQNGKQKSAAVRSTTAASLKKSADSRILSNGGSNEAPTFHILTPASGEGFVIVSGEEIENPIIGYSFEGTIDTNNLPVGFVDYITDIDAQVKALRKYNAENPQKAAAARSAMQKTNYNATTMGEQAVLLETAKWGQSAPFNAQCWTTAAHTTQALTGCVPTAFAIIMRYHEWPMVGTGAIQDCQDEELPYTYYDNRTYDYSKMPLVYDSNWTEEQKNEVAKLMSHLGHAFGVSYGTGSTSVTMGNSLTTATKKYFNYQDCSISNQYNNGSLTDFTEWKNNLKNSLDNNCPVPYGANNIGSGTVDARHMFVVDGYTDDDYFHFNFGWNGGSNGWYKLDAITVGYSWSDDANGYTSKHQAFFNLTPDKTKYPVTATVEPENAGTVTVNPAEQVEGGIVTLTATANTGYTFSNWTKGGEVVSTNKSCQIKVASSDNDYVANFLTVGNTTVNVQVTYNSSYGTVTGTSGTVANGTTLTPRLNEEVTLTATPADGYIFTGWTVTKGTESTNYSGTSLTFVATGEMSVTANFALAVQDYVVNPTTGTLNNGTNRSSVWTFTTVGDFTAALSISATDSNGNVVNSITNKTSGTAGHYFAPSGIIANTETPSSSPTIYTISVPNGYKITGYAITYYPENGSITLTNELGHNETATSSSSDYYLNASGLNVQSTTYTVAGTGRMTTLSFSVTVMKDGAGSGSTPTPTQYTITATANPGTAGSVTGGGTYNEGATVTLTATPNSGYEFVNWTSGTTTVSTNATYSFTANASAEYIANFRTAAPTTFAVTTTANPAAGGTATFAVGTGQATTSATVASGTGVTLYAVANNGYRFVNWTLDGNVVSTDATCNVTVSQAANYVANFDEEAQAGTFPDGAYKIYWQADNRGYLAYHATDYPNEAKLAGVTYSGCQNIHYAVGQVDLVWYLITADDGKRYLFQAATGKFLGVDTSIQANGTGNKLSTTEAWPIAIEENTKHTGHYIITTEINGTNSLLCSGCGTSKEQHPVRWLTVNDTNQTDGGAPLQLIPVNDVTVADNVMNAVLAVINGTDEPEQQTLNVTYSGATWNNEASGWWVSVVTNTTPAVTVKTTDGTPKIGYSTFNEVRHPYLLDGNSFTISVPANCKITGYRLGYKAHNLVSKSVTYTNGKQSTGTITIAQSNEENTLTVTGLDNNEISFSVEDQSSQAGFIIKSLEITYVENEFEPAMFKAEIEGWRDNNPNTHLGTITIGGTAMKLTPAHQTASELTMPVVEGTALAFTRKYRGFEFNGFYIGSTELGTNPTLTAENVAAIDENNPLIAKFTATDDVTLFYDDDEFSYRIPAIAKTGNGMLVAVSDYRHNLDDIGRDNHGTGTKRIDLVMRTSTDNGATWSETKTIAAGDNNKEGSYQRAYGDAAIAAVGQNIVVMAAAGDVVYTAGTTSSPNKMARIYSTDNGATWTIEEMTTKMYSQSTSLIPSGGSAFFGSGKLAVDPNFNGTGNARIYGALLVRIGTDGYNNFGVFSDDLGATWKILGGDNTNPVAKGDEPKVEILPNGQILLSARRGGGRVFRVFTYGDDKANGAGSWGDAAVNGCDNGGSNATNGEIICLDAKKPNGKPTKILLQSQPKGGSGQYDRKDVTIWYKEVSADETYTSATIASGWTMGKQVSTVQSSYSAMTLQENGEIALFFEEAPCYGNDYTKGYSMVYVPLTIEEITNDNFLNPNAVVETVTVDVTLTDEQGNTYTHQFDYLPGDAAAIDAALKAAYPFITELGEGNLQGSDTYYTYTNTVTLPFKVSNANTTVWHNIYWPANQNPAFYPIYLAASKATDTYVPKVTEAKVYGESQYNTLAYADKLSWAVYSVNNTLTFKFKNKLTGKFMAVNSVVSSGNANNVIYTDEANATAFTLTKNPGTNNTWKGDYAITSVYNSTTGYVCNTSASYANATNYASYAHPGAWAKFVEAPDYAALIEEVKAALAKFGDAAGQYTPNSEDIDNIAAARTAMANSGSLVLDELNGYKAFATEALARATENYTLYVTSAGYATMYLGYPAAIPAGVEAYTVTSVSESHAALTPVTGVLPAETGVIIKAKMGEYTFTYSTDTPAVTEGNLLYGSIDETLVTDEAYVLSMQDGIVGLYKAEMNQLDGTAFKNNANRAYLPAAMVGGYIDVAFFAFEFDVPSSHIVGIGTAGYSTLYLDFPAYIPNGLEIYVIKAEGINEEEGYISMTEIKNGIPAYTGVIIKGEPGEYQFDYSNEIYAEIEENLLKGTVEDAYITEESYVLSVVDGEVGLYLAQMNQLDGTAFKNNANKAYLPKGTATNLSATFYGFGWNGTTGIDNVNGDSTAGAQNSKDRETIFDLFGRRIESINSPGIYIVNGRKVLVK